MRTSINSIRYLTHLISNMYWIALSNMTKIDKKKSPSILSSLEFELEISFIAEQMYSNEQGFVLLVFENSHQSNQ